MIAMDICGPFPTSDRGKKYTLVAADYFTKWPECWAITDQEAKTVARCLEEFISRHGVPQVLLTDQGRNFESQVVTEVCDLLHINKKRTTAYHPQCDGQVERFNRTLANMLTMYVDKNQKDWDLWLEQVLFAYRTSIMSLQEQLRFPCYMEGKPNYQLTCALHHHLEPHGGETTTDYKLPNCNIGHIVQACTREVATFTEEISRRIL